MNATQLTELTKLAMEQNPYDKKPSQNNKQSRTRRKYVIIKDTDYLVED